MKNTILTSIMLILSISAFAKSNQKEVYSSERGALKGSKFFLLYQAFASHDVEGTSIDTVKNEGDYILFSDNGKAYMNFKGQNDSIEYKFVQDNSITFGDTPFVIVNIGNGYFTLYQNEEEKNGDYNRVTYLLKKEEKELSYSK